ncbi:MAG: hypothetical protein GX892_10070 [Thermoanaerobacteraceae bacterium]|nr:hypothetical protein [Thermoanaerobacteraceae bacterium]
MKKGIALSSLKSEQAGEVFTKTMRGYINGNLTLDEVFEILIKNRKGTE